MHHRIASLRIASPAFAYNLNYSITWRIYIHEHKPFNIITRRMLMRRIVSATVRIARDQHEADGSFAIMLPLNEQTNERTNKDTHASSIRSLPERKSFRNSAACVLRAHESKSSAGATSTDPNQYRQHQQQLRVRITLLHADVDDNQQSSSMRPLDFQSCPDNRQAIGTHDMCSVSDICDNVLRFCTSVSKSVRSATGRVL